MSGLSAATSASFLALPAAKSSYGDERARSPADDRVPIDEDQGPFYILGDTQLAVRLDRG
jgi:hypothetical protein